MPDFSKAQPVSRLPNRAVPGLLLATPDGRVWRAECIDGTGAYGWYYVGDLPVPSSLERKIAEIDREWPPKWMPNAEIDPKLMSFLPPVRVTRKLLRDLGLDPDSFK